MAVRSSHDLQEGLVSFVYVFVALEERVSLLADFHHPYRTFALALCPFQKQFSSVVGWIVALESAVLLLDILIVPIPVAKFWTSSEIMKLGILSSSRDGIFLKAQPLAKLPSLLNAGETMNACKLSNCAPYHSCRLLLRHSEHHPEYRVGSQGVVSFLSRSRLVGSRTRPRRRR